MINATRFTYTDDDAVAVDLTTSIASRPWVPTLGGVGGIEFSAADVPSSFEIRQRPTLKVTLRYTEAEAAAVEKLLDHARRGVPITVYPNGEDAATSRVCYAAPGWARSLWEQGIQPQRGESTGELTIETEWLSTEGSWAGVGYYG
jgi:hypothetical protein